MNKAITEGLQLMPPSFAEGLDVWSSGDGTAGSATYEFATNAAYVPGDADFGAAFEVVKVADTTKLRYMGKTPMMPGMYLRVTARVKAVSGNLPSVRIAGWAGSSSNNHVGGIVETGPAVALTEYGAVVEVSAIVGSGKRGGVDMPWGLSADYGHFGVDLVGANGGTVRIDDIVIEDVTSAFFGDSSGMIDVRDYGAVGDGTTDCHAAFEAADNAANGRKILVPEGEYRIGSNLTLVHEPVFQGSLDMDISTRLCLRRGFDLNSYIDAFGDEVFAFKKAFQALLNYTDHDALDLCGRRIEIDEPIDMHATVGNKDNFEIRRVVRNGQFNVESSSNWNTETTTSSASYSSSKSLKLTDVANVANIEVGSHVTGYGVGREVYVRAVNVGAKEVTLSQPLFGAKSSQTYTFRRYKYVLDFSGFSKLSQIQFNGVEFLCNGHASAVMLAPTGATFGFEDCHFKSPAKRAITSIGTGCQGMTIDRCYFTSDEQDVSADARSSVAFNANGNDTKIRNNRFQRFGHTGVLSGSGHMFVGNHWFQGDNNSDSPRVAGIVFTGGNLKSVITGNYIDNSFIELTNEHDANPDFTSGYSFGGLSITGNIFTVNDSVTWFSWIVVKPYGTGHYIQGLSVQGNTFKSLNGSTKRIEKVDTTYANLDYGRMRNIVFAGNTFNGISETTFNPVSLDFTQSSASKSWVLDPATFLPFGGWARTVDGLVMRDAITEAGGAKTFAMPYVTLNYGSNSDRVRLDFPEAVKGSVQVTVRVDKPI